MTTNDEMYLSPAANNPAGSVVVGMTPDQRDGLRNGLVLIAAGLTAAALGVGYFVGRDKGRKANPEHPLLALRPSAILRQLIRR